MEHWIYVIVGGAIIGWVASLIMRAKMGLAGGIMAGIVGSMVGRFVAQTLHLGGGRLVWWALSVAGACLVIAIFKAVAGDRITPA